MGCFLPQCSASSVEIKCTNCPFLFKNSSWTTDLISIGFVRHCKWLEAVTSSKFTTYFTLVFELDAQRAGLLVARDELVFVVTSNDAMPNCLTDCLVLDFYKRIWFSASHLLDVPLLKNISRKHESPFTEFCKREYWSIISVELATLDMQIGQKAKILKHLNTVLQTDLKV